MTYSAKTIYPQFKCLTTFKAVMKRIENAGNKYWKKGLRFQEHIARGIFKDLKYIEMDFSCEYHKQEQVFKKISRRGTMGKRFVKLYKRIQEENKRPIGFYDKDPSKAEEVANWYKNNKKLKSEYPYLLHKQLYTDEYIISSIGGAWKRYKDYKMMKYAKKGEFYDAMLTRDKMLGMGNSLPDEIIGKIFQYL